MTVPVTTERRTWLPWHRHATAGCAVAAARLLTLLPPRWLCRVLRVLAAGSRPATEAGALDARTAVVSASIRCAGQGCLQRSVATALLCRLHGTWPDWHVGVRTRPFRSHAWVQVAGRAVGEAEDMTLYRTVLSVASPTRRRR